MKTKYIFGGIIIVVFLAIMAYLFTQTNISYVNDFSKVMKTGRVVRATGSWVKEKSYKIDRQKNLFTFYIKDANGKIMKVVYHGSIPNNFEAATSMVVTGKYRNGYFEASDILTKCPSKYQGQNKKSTS